MVAALACRTKAFHFALCQIILGFLGAQMQAEIDDSRLGAKQWTNGNTIRNDAHILISALIHQRTVFVGMLICHVSWVGGHSSKKTVPKKVNTPILIHWAERDSPGSRECRLATHRSTRCEYLASTDLRDAGGTAALRHGEWTSLATDR